VKEGDEGTLKLGAAARVDRGGRERLPHNRLANVRCNEQRDAGAEPVTLLQQLVQRDHDHARDEQLQDDEDRVPRAKLAHVAVHAGDDVRDGLADGHQDAEQLLRAAEQRAVLLQTLVDIDDLRAGEELHDEARGDDGRNAEFHQRAAVGGEQDAHPVERVR